MKRNSTGFIFLALGYILLWTQCDLQFDTIKHPIEIQTNSTTTIPVQIVRGEFPAFSDSILTTAISELSERLVDLNISPPIRGGNHLWLGMQIPENWSTLDSFVYVAYDSLPATIIDSGMFVYSTDHINLLDTLEYLVLHPGNKWIAWVSQDTMKMTEGKMWTDIPIITDDSAGHYYLSYYLGHDLEEPCDKRENIITVAGQMLDTSWVTNTFDSGSGSLRDAIYNVRAGGNVEFTINDNDTIILSDGISVYRSFFVNSNDPSQYINIKGPDSNHIFQVNHDQYNRYPVSGVYPQLNLNNLNLFGAGNSAVYAYMTRWMWINDSRIHDNLGPGIELNNEYDSVYPYIQIQGCEIFNNTTEEDGGAIRLIGIDQVYISSCNIYNNTAYDDGGGIYARGSYINLYGTNISNNSSDYGGGIYSVNSMIRFYDGTKINNNHAEYYGGGIYNDGTTWFTPSQRSSIYLNRASIGNDLYTTTPMTITVDTFTVLEPYEFHASPIEEYTFDILKGYYPQVDADLFVSPDGNDNNTGLTADDPLKTIHSAFTRLITNDSVQRSVNLLGGTYSPTTNGEVFPLTIPDHVDMKGTSEDSVVLDADKTARVVNIHNNHNTLMTGMTITGGEDDYRGGGMYAYESNIKLKKLVFKDNNAENYGGGISINNSIIEIDSVKFLNNTARYGGGLDLVDNTMNLNNVQITKNEAIDGGGGIWCWQSHVNFENVTISFNDAGTEGGGAYFYNNTLSFSDTNRCNIYHNRARSGNDIYLGNGGATIRVDTFTVLYPGDYYAEPINKIGVNAWNAKLEQVDADLYVSPSGNNENSGLSPEDPLHTIDHAFSILRADDQFHHHTVHLLEGTYSPGTNSEPFPIFLPSRVNLAGVDKESVVLNAEGGSSVIEISENSLGRNLISGLTITGGKANYGGGINTYEADPVIKDAILVGNEAVSDGGGMFFLHSSPLIQNCLIRNNVGTGIYLWYTNSLCQVTNSVIENNQGAGIFLRNSSSFFKNVLITGNARGAFNLDNSDPRLLNVTCADHDSIPSRGAMNILQGNCSPWIKNCIFWNEGPEIYVAGSESSVRILYSDVEGGEAGVVTNEYGSVYWLEGNIDEDPDFNLIGSEEVLYTLSGSSPCIDAGTPDTTGMGLPLKDLLGNIRVWDGDGDGIPVLDMGAFEYGSIPVGVDQSSVGSRQSSVIVYPNPTSGVTSFGFRVSGREHVTLKIYDLQGREVATVVDEVMPEGEHVVSFDASHLPPGVYIYRKSSVVSRQSSVGSHQWAVGKLIKF